MTHNNQKGFSLVELLVGILVAAIVVLAIGAIGTIAFQSYNGMRNNIGVYNDSQFALQLIREGVRESTTIPGAVPGSLNLNTAGMESINGGCTTLHFYIQGGTDLVYDHACGGSPLIMGDPIIKDVSELEFTPTLESGQLVKVILKGKKNGQTFNYLIYVTGRNSWPNS
jgi:prepilin-type N-terminal cleavage/methylation domain-containing protein